MYVLYGRRIVLGLIAIIIIVLALRGIPHRPVGGIPLSLERLIGTRLNMLFSERAEAVICGDIDTLASHYDLDSRYGQWAFDHEMRRSAYLTAWSAARGIKFLDTEVEIRINSIELRGTTAWIELDESTKIVYRHKSQSASKFDFFGIGTEHFIELAFKDGAWLVRRDWYLDPLDVDADSISTDAALVSTSENLLVTPGQLDAHPGEVTRKDYDSIYDRENAVAYAEKYCGLAWGCGNNHKYNPSYKNFTGLGGDCTNFASQILGDEQAGNLPMTYTWRYVPYGPTAGATRAWAQASGLLNYLLSSGRAKTLARATYANLITPSETYPVGAIGALNRGDLIVYEDKGRIVHFAVVVSQDSGSYLVVNSHTADRYHVPWDLGWDRSTIFWLIKIVV